MPDLTRVPTAPLLAGGLVGGFTLAQQTGVRPLGGAAMLAANARPSASGTPSAACRSQPG